MTEFTKQELLRITHKLSETDPSTSAYHCLMQSIEYLNSIGQTVDEIIALEESITYPQSPIALNRCNAAEPAKEEEWVKEEPVEEAPKPKKMEAISHAELAEKEIEPEPEKPEEPEEEWVKEADEAPEVSYNQAEVRAALASARRKGVNVASLIKSHGADNFTAVDPLHYPAIMREIEEELKKNA